MLIFKNILPYFLSIYSFYKPFEINCRHYNLSTSAYTSWEGKSHTLKLFCCPSNMSKYVMFLFIKMHKINSSDQQLRNRNNCWISVFQVRSWHLSIEETLRGEHPLVTLIVKAVIIDDKEAKSRVQTWRPL